MGGMNGEPSPGRKTGFTRGQGRESRRNKTRQHSTAQHTERRRRGGYLEIKRERERESRELVLMDHGWWLLCAGRVGWLNVHATHGTGGQANTSRQTA